MAKFTQAKVIEALKATKGMVYLAADRLGCDPKTIYNYRDRYPAVRAVMEAEDGKIDDVAEMKLYQALIAGESWAVQFRLRTKGRNRGYSERKEITGKDGGDLAITVQSTDYRAGLAILAPLDDDDESSSPEA